MTADPVGKVVGGDRTAMVHVGDGAWMSFPTGDWLWQMNHCPEPARPGKCSDRMLAVSVIESYLYLIQSCTKEEVWRRIKIIRSALADREILHG